MKINEELVVCKSTICGKEYETYIKLEDWNEIAGKFGKKTGYERVERGEGYWYDDGAGGVGSEQEDKMSIDDELHLSANYYSSKEVAENNARAAQLMRKLRRFAVEHRGNSNPQRKFYIQYLYLENILQVVAFNNARHLCPWFDSIEAGGKAIEEFKDELIWYFTEYKDSL